MTMHRKVNVLIFAIYAQKGSFERKKKSSLIILLSSSSLPPPQKKNNSFKIHYNNISLPWAPAFFYQGTSFASPTAKPIGPC